MNKQAHHIFIVVILAVLMDGCGTQYHAVVNGFQNREQQIPLQATFVVLPVATKENDLAFQEYARMVERKLEERGYRKADVKAADLAVFISYGIDSGSVRNYSYSMPVYGTSNFSGSSFGSGGSSYFSGTTSGIVGSQTVAGSVKEYTRTLIVDVVDLAKVRTEGAIVSIWKGEIESAGSSSDLRLVMPVLIEAGFRHFGENTKKGIRHIFRENDIEVEKLRAVQ